MSEEKVEFDPKSNERQAHLVSFLTNELLHAVGKLAIEEGEAWRLSHPELMDSYEALRSELEQLMRLIVRKHED